LLSLSPEVRAQLRSVTTTRRIVPEKEVEKEVEVIEVKMATEPEYDEEEQWPSIEEIDYCMPDEIPYTSGIAEVSPVELFLVEPSSTKTPRTTIYLEDPIEQYYRTLNPGDDSDPNRL